MSKRTIYLIIGLITSAIIGVIFLQMDMIRTGMKVNEQRYDETVLDALRAAARELESQEDAQINYEADSRNSLNASSSLTGRSISQALETPSLLTRPKLNSSTPSFSTRLSVQTEFASYQLIKRIDHRSLDRLINKEFTNAQLSGNLEYGVYDNRREEFVVRNGRRLSTIGSEAARHQDLMTSSYKVSLFENHGYLMAFSPRKKTVILQSIGLNLIASFLFVSIILGCFIYTIYTILLQNKLSVMKTDFINNMTHEFKTPIATISLATDSLKSPKIAPFPEKVARFVNIIKQENRRMNNQVEKVLQMAKLDKSRLHLSLTAVDINRVAAEAVEYISLQVEPRGGTVVTELNAAPAVVEGDMTHISSLINNLLDNANKYSPEEPKIVVSTRNVSKGVEVTVKDHGLGMSREARKNIFDRFYRVHSGDRHDVKGFGLGLSYVKTITEVHNGTINVKSELGEGSSFIITFPYRQS
ncbi:MAG: two-component system phosphate regulon sensor histidine kinase PhoR [Neolewinella sp.]|jgi:two-component system phosphate regulon sensor histidine kinase PhoR